jgi:hypothetical protein
MDTANRLRRKHAMAKLKPHTTPHGHRHHTAPEHNHAVLSEAEQAKFLGRDNEVVSNLGHPSREDDLMKHPLRSVPAYDGKDIITEKRSVGVYGKFKDPKSGISAEQNLDRWADYARQNSYHGKDGKDPVVKDPRGSHSNESDGYLRSTKGWAGYEYGSESGLGRIEKTHRK